MIRRFLFILSLVAVFGLGQQGAAAHAISHMADGQGESQQHKQLPHSQNCEKCVVYAQLGSAIDTEHTLLLLAVQHQQTPQKHGVHRASRHTAQYAARAPPVLS